jgi:phosphate acetyltransferase
MVLLNSGQADGLVAGASVTTATVVRASLQAIGPLPGVGTVSGAFLLAAPNSTAEPLILADCAVVPEPNTEQLVEIADQSGRLFERLVARRPAIAFLSFSTRGSAKHPASRIPAAAAAQLAADRPAWRVAGEVQVDAALVPEVARAKGINWGKLGKADVLIFPELASGNIGYKLVERLGGWRAIGPWLQGLRRSVCDLSRGCSALDVVDASVLVATQYRSPAGGDR